MATAMPTSAVWNWSNRSPWSETFTFGCRRIAIAAAFTMRSLKETFTSAALACSRTFDRLLHVDVDGDVEVRDARLHLGHALGDDLPHPGDAAGPPARAVRRSERAHPRDAVPAPERERSPRPAPAPSPPPRRASRCDRWDPSRARPTRSSPSSRAIRLASGEARSRPSSCAGAVAASSARRMGTTWAGPPGFCARSSGCGCSRRASGAGPRLRAVAPWRVRERGRRGFAAGAWASTFSPFAPMTAMGAPTLPVSPSVTRIFEQHAVVERLDLEVRLVGLDLGDGLTGGDAVPFLLEPLDDLPLRHRGGERRELHLGGHRQVPSSRYMTFFTAATIRSADTSVAFSSTAA